MNNLKNLKLQRKFKFLFNQVSYLEDFIIGNKFKNYVNLENKCIFVTGMPRSGTTLLTHIISNFEGVGSFNYSDLPFTKIPFFWSKIKRFYYLKNKSFERPHGDGLKINLSSPDAFEELIWAENIKEYEKGNFSQKLNSEYVNDILKNELTRSINKILILRKKKIYLSKGNYNLFRINYIKKILRNSLFIICIRNPLNVIESSIRVHKKFLELDNKNRDFTNEMNELCHFEFGKNRKDPFGGHLENDEYKYYEKQWIKTHEMILEKYIDLENVFLIDFDKFVNSPDKSLPIILKNINVDFSSNINNVLKKINKSNQILMNNNKNEKILNLYNQLLNNCIN